MRTMARIGGPWISESSIAQSVRIEPVAVLLCLTVAAWVIYKVLLRKASLERHRNLRGLFKNLLGHLAGGLSVYALYEALQYSSSQVAWPEHLLPYAGFIAIVWGCIVFIKIARIMAFEYLFLNSMKAGVPLLLVNIFTLVLSLIAAGWIMTSIFSVNLTSILATSAILSIVLGLALQDTLGNLFAGIALQFDKPFELGDWIEVRNGTERISGQVFEVSWRATVLIAITDELITIPNRNMAQWQVSNFSARERPFLRSHIFRVPFGTDLEKAKAALVVVAHSVPGILRNPGPSVIATETTDSWIALKAVYGISDYGLQYGIADRFLEKAIAALDEIGVELAMNRLAVNRVEARRDDERSISIG